MTQQERKCKKKKKLLLVFGPSAERVTARKVVPGLGWVVLFGTEEQRLSSSHRRVRVWVWLWVGVSRRERLV